MRRLAAVKGKIDNALLIDDLGHRIFLGFDHGAGGRDADAFRKRAELQDHVELNAVANLERDTLAGLSFETVRLHFKPVWSDRKFGSVYRPWLSVTVVRTCCLSVSVILT